MEKILALRRERAKYAEEMLALVNNAENQGRGLNEEEQKKWDVLHTKAKDLDARIKVLEETEAINRDVNTIVNGGHRPQPGATAEGGEEYPFKNLGELLNALRFNGRDSRLHMALDMNVGEGGGYMVPPAFRDSMFEVAPQEAIVRPRATVIPPGDIPDQEEQWPALNQEAGQGMYGGVSVAYTKSGTEKPMTDFKIKKITVKPVEYAGYIEVPDNLLRNWQSAGALIERLFRGAAIAFEDDKFLTGGLGVGEPLAVLNSGALLTQNRAQANEISYADVIAMYTKFFVRGSAGIFTYNPTCLAQLMTMESSQGDLIWAFSAREGEPDRLLGLPAIRNVRQPGLGSKGDLMLSDFNYYLVKDGSGPFIASSEHYKFRDNLTAIKFFSNHDGKPWMNGPIVDEDGNSYSPFVALDVPSGG